MFALYLPCCLSDCGSDDERWRINVAKLGKMDDGWRRNDSFWLCSTVCVEVAVILAQSLMLIASFCFSVRALKFKAHFPQKSIILGLQR